MTISDTETSSAAERVRDEALTLVRFRKSFRVGELLAIRRYAWRRAAFPKPEGQLSDEEAEWRNIFSSFDDLLRRTVGPQKKAELDSLELREQDLGLAARMLEYRDTARLGERPLGIAIVVVAVIVGSLLGWILARSVWAAVAFAVSLGLAAMLASVIVLQDTWSSSTVASLLNRIGRLLRSDQLRNVAGRLMESNVLHAQRYYETGDPVRAAGLLRRLDEQLIRQGSALLNAIAILQSEAYIRDVRNAEKAAVDPASSPAARLAHAQLLVQASDRYRQSALSPLETGNDECEVELYELERQLRGLPAGERRSKFLQWRAPAKSEYLSGIIITNVIRNWFDMDVDIARQVVAREGNVDFAMDAEPIAETFAQIEALTQLQAERAGFRTVHETVKRELLGVIA